MTPARPAFCRIESPSMPRRALRRAALGLLLCAAGIGGSAQAVPNDTFRSWSYVYLPGGGLLSDGQRWDADPSLWTASSSAWYSGASHARSQIGFEDGQLAAKIEVSGASPVTGHVYSELVYRDQGFVCDAGSCGTAVPSSAAVTINLKQDGRFTEGSANYSVSYNLWTAGTAYSFHFAVQQGEMPLAPYGWFSTENLVTGQTTLENIWTRNAGGQPVLNPLFNLVWEDDNHDGVYNFSYDLAFTVATQGVDLKEQLFMSAYVYGSPGVQFFDSYNSFHSTWTPEPGVTLTGAGGRSVVGPVPEPASWALMSAGLGVLTAVATRRRCRQA